MNINELRKSKDWTIFYAELLKEPATMINNEQFILEKYKEWIKSNEPIFLHHE